MLHFLAALSLASVVVVIHFLLWILYIYFMGSVVVIHSFFGILYIYFMGSVVVIHSLFWILYIYFMGSVVEDKRKMDRGSEALSPWLLAGGDSVRGLWGYSPLSSWKKMPCLEPFLRGLRQYTEEKRRPNRPVRFCNKPGQVLYILYAGILASLGDWIPPSPSPFVHW